MDIENIIKLFEEYLQENDIETTFDSNINDKIINDFITLLHYEIIDNIKDISELEEINQNIYSILDNYCSILPF